MTDRWRYGDIVVRREVLGLSPVRDVDGRTPPWHGRPWMAVPVHVVEDTADALVTYIAPGAEFGFFPGEWPTPDTRHPWAGRAGWSGHGCLMVQRPGDHHAVWHFWSGPAREFACWYINIQTDFLRTAGGYDTQDLELDIVVYPDGTWLLKDDDVLVDRIDEGRFSPLLVEWIEALGAQLTAQLQTGTRWWDDAWSRWTPDDAWRNTALPAGWADH
jgi:hypothetical protein